MEQGGQLFLLERYEEATFEYEQALLFCPNDELRKKISFCKGKILVERSDSLFRFKKYSEAGDLYRQAILFDLDIKERRKLKGKVDDEDAAIDYVELMLEGYDGKRKIVFVEGVNDSDEYDDNYNQYYELDDPGDKLDEYLEKIGLL